MARELPYHDFAARFPDAVPFHRILYFKERGVVVWEQRALRRVDLPPGGARKGLYLAGHAVGVDEQASL